MDAYNKKGMDYFSKSRVEIEPLLPKSIGCVLEIGCGQGQTLNWLKAVKGAQLTCGIEITESQGVYAREVVDRLVIDNAEERLLDHFGHESFDLVLCLDVLEHMVDPWAFVEKVSSLIKPGGYLITSVPNVRHLSVVLPLLFKGEWSYQDEGVLDRTHLRFFTGKAVKALVSGSGLSFECCVPNFYPGSLSTNLNRMSLGMLEDFLALQYLTRSQKIA